jgi:hypothetical protein
MEISGVGCDLAGALDTGESESESNEHQYQPGGNAHGEDASIQLRGVGDTAWHYVSDRN